MNIKLLPSKRAFRVVLLTLLLCSAGMTKMNAQRPNQFSQNTIENWQSPDRNSEIGFAESNRDVPVGAINGLFTVSEGHQVYFSQGNLQYQASTNIWRFAEHQWDNVGGENYNISPTYDGWIDLFAWGTSNYDHGAVCYQPWSTSINTADYNAYGFDFYNLYDQTGQADWGYNAISNGGNDTNTWRTLTMPEWQFIINNRETLSGIRFAKGIVNEMNGMILLPDSWDPAVYELNDTNNSSSEFNTNILSVSQWSVLEQHGAVFLPAEGYRRVMLYVYNLGMEGHYWSSSYCNDGYAASLAFAGGYCISCTKERFCGYSVRLVRSSQNYSFNINATPNPMEGGTVTGTGTYSEGSTCTLTATANEGYTFLNWTENGTEVSTNATYSFMVVFDRNLSANFVVSTNNEYEYVDLGLPSGTLWATCNIGANSPEEYGDYFAWGEIQPKNNYSWNTYQYCMGNYNTLTKYCNNASYGYNGFYDNLMVLDASDDAATAQWGSNWRMPTEEEWQELYNNTTYIWTTQNGIYGRLFTASNGITLFLPFAGYYVNGTLYGVGSNGDYWSSSLLQNNPGGAWLFYVTPGNNLMNWYDRSCGLSVRAVRSNAEPTSEVPEGAINGVFSVGEGQQVYFSQGNLQYQASTNTWKFADNQWAYVGYGNNNISSTYDGWIDLFGWGTSGYDHGAVCYKPWSTSVNDADYFAYGNPNANLFDQTGQADWGYNAISNGGNLTGLWKTLTDSEWNYVLNIRVTPSGIRYTEATVKNVCGLILLPDNWDSSIYTLRDINGGNYNSNYISESEWDNILEANGAVFLPAAGDRIGTSIFHDNYTYVGYAGFYWSASSGWAGETAGSLCFYNSLIYPNGNNFCSGDRLGGHSVRLVHSVQSYSYNINATPNPMEGGTVTGAGVYYEGTTCTLTATAHEGYSFVNWTENGTVVSENSVYAFTVTGSRNLIANFNDVSSGYVITATANPTEGGRIVFGMGEQTLLFEPFEEYTVGNKIAAGAIAAGHDWWTTWSNSPGSNEDGTIANYDGTQCGHFTYGSDQVLLLGDEETGVYDLEFDILVPQGKNGYFNVLHHFAGGASTWAMQCYLHMTDDGQNSTQAPGHGTIHAGSNGTADIPCVYDAWMHFRLHVDTDNDVASYYYTAPGEEEILVCEWQWSLDSFGANVTTRTLAAMDFFPSENAATSEFYIDNISFSQSRSESALEANGGTLRTSGTYEAGSTCTLTAIANPGYTFTNWTKNGIVVSTTSTYSFTVTENAAYVANFSQNQGEITQVSDLAQGWNWWSTYIEQDGIDGLTMLEQSLGTNGHQIKSQTDFVTNYGSIWMGMLSSINNEETYMIDNTANCQIEMIGTPASPANHPITVSSGWNWIGYPCTNTMSVTQAFSGYTPANGDQIKSQSDYSMYYSGMWIGQLQSITPGTGLMYLSNNATTTTLIYPEEGRNTAAITSPKATHWTNDIHAYPNNMTVMAVINLDDEELSSDNYELAAFDINGECRGSVKLTYVEPINHYVAFLTVSGKEAAELNFGLYDSETGCEYFNTEEALVYVTNATIGNPEEPYVVRFRSTMGIDELASSVQVYPNPVSPGEHFSIGMDVESKTPVRVEIVNVLGVEMLRATSVQMPTTLTAPATAGVYTLRITMKGKRTLVRKLIVK